MMLKGGSMDPAGLCPVKTYKSLDLISPGTSKSTFLDRNSTDPSRLRLLRSAGILLGSGYVLLPLEAPS